MKAAKYCFQYGSSWWRSNEVDSDGDFSFTRILSSILIESFALVLASVFTAFLSMHNL